MKKILKEYGAYIVAAILFLILGFTYCKPSLQGKVLQSGDDVNAVSAVHEAVAHDRSEGDFGFWNATLFSGMPNYQIGGGTYASSKLLGPLTRFFHRGTSHPAWIIIFYLVCFFILLRSFGVDKWLSIAGAVAIALSSYFIVIIGAGHGGKTISISYISMVAAGFYLIYRKKYALGAIFTMIFSAVGFSTHPQMSYYIFMMIGVFFIAEVWEHIREKRVKDLGIATAIFAVSLGIGLGTGCSNIFANSEYAEQTMRGGHSDLVRENETSAPSKGLDIEYATQWSYGIDETMTFLIPGFLGGTSTASVGTDSDIYRTMIKEGFAPQSARAFCSQVPLYWGEQPFTSGNVYMGAIICFLFILGCLIVKGPYKWALLASTLFSVMLAWGSNFMPLTKLFFNYFPMYNKFRAVSSILVVAEIAMPLLGFLALKEICENKPEKKALRKNIFISAGVTAGLCLVFALLGKSLFGFTSTGDAAFADQLPDWLYSAIVSERANLFTGDCWRSFLFIAAGAGLLLLFNGKKIKYSWFVAILTVLIVADMWPVDKRYFNDSYFKSPKEDKSAYALQPYEASLLEDPDPHFRVMNLTTSTFNESRTSYYLKSIGGYHAAKLRRYQDLIDVYLSKVNMPVIGMLNAKYFIAAGEDGEPQPLYNPYALGNAWFVEKLEVVDGANAEMEALGRIQLGSEAVLDKEFKDYVSDLNPGIAEDAEINLTKYSAKALDYSYTSSKPGTVVFSEIYYPYGWKASIDGAPADHFRVNYVLRAMNVPAGSHSIHFEFDPDSVRKGDTIAVICTILMYGSVLILIGIAIFGCIKKRRNGVTEG